MLQHCSWVLVLGARIASEGQHRHLLAMDEDLDRLKGGFAHLARAIKALASPGATATVHVISTTK